MVIFGDSGTFIAHFISLRDLFKRGDPMKNRISLFVAFLLISAIVFSFGCTAPKIGGEEEVEKEEGKITYKASIGEEPKINKFIFGQEVKEEVINEDPNAPAEKELVRAFFSAAPDGTNIQDLSPGGISGLDLNTGIAPNNDFWFWTEELGISVSGDGGTHLLISNEELFQKFTNGNESGWYQLKQLQEQVENKQFVELNVYFAPKGDEKNNYIALMLFKVSVTKKPDKEVYSNLWVRFDSETNEYEFIIPAMNLVIDPESYNGWYPNIIQTKYYSSLSKLHYRMIPAQYPNGNNVAGPKIDVVYDPLTKSHTATRRVDKTPNSIYGLTDSWVDTEQYKDLGFSAYNGCFAYTESKKIGFEECKKNIESSGGESEAADGAEACTNEKLSNTNAQIYCGPKADITKYVASTEGIKHLSELKSEKPMTLIGSINGAQLVEAVAECEEYVCKPNLDSFTVTWPATYFAGPYKHAIFFGGQDPATGNAKKLYAFDKSDGETFLIDSEDEKIGFSQALPQTAETSAGPLFIYKKIIKEDNATAHFVFDPEKKEGFQLTNFVSTNYHIDVLTFACGGPTNLFEHCRTISYGRQKAFVRLTIVPEGGNIYDKVNLIVNIYMTDLTSLFNAEKKEGEDSILGGTWTLAHPLVKEPGLRTYMWALMGDKILWQRWQWSPGSPSPSAMPFFWNQPPDSLHEITAPGGTTYYSFVGILHSKKIELPEKYTAAAFTPDTNVFEKFECKNQDEIKQATYCPGKYDRCMKEKCMDWYHCSTFNPNGACDKQGATCSNGECWFEEEPAPIPDDDCPGGPGDTEGPCGEPPTEPPPTEACVDNADGACNKADVMPPAPPPAAGCTENADCPKDGICIDGACNKADVMPPAPPPCEDDKECKEGLKCDNGACVSKCPSGTIFYKDFDLCVLKVEIESLVSESKQAFIIAFNASAKPPMLAYIFTVSPKECKENSSYTISNQKVTNLEALAEDGYYKMELPELKPGYTYCFKVTPVVYSKDGKRALVEEAAGSKDYSLQ